MPARSNIYQRLVASIHRELEPGWVVTESRLLIDQRTGEPREVDVVAEATFGTYRLLIGIEVRDRSRPADVTWVESMAKKHEDLGTNKLVLWSASGFSSNAIKKAQSLNIDTLTSEFVESTSWAQLARALVGASIKFVRPEFTLVADVSLPDGTLVRWTLNEATSVREKHGSREGLLGTMLKQLTDSPDFRTLLLDHAPDGAGDFYAIYSLPFSCIITGPNNEIGEVLRLIIGMKTLSEVAPVDTRSVLYNGNITTLSEAALSDGQFQFFAREQPDGSKNTIALYQPKKG